MFPRSLPLAAVLAACAFATAPPAAAQDPPARFERFTLENGLRVTLRPIEGAKQAAVVVLFDFGENADPPGRSGLAHLCEHLYATAAAGETKARTVEEWMKAYSGGCNAQTGWDYSVFAGTVSVEGLDAELRDAAARMGALAPVEADLEREKPRLLAEVENMFGGLPTLGAQNNVKAALFRRSGRRGGLPDEVRTIPLAEAATTLARLYRPCNARLVVVGAMDAAAVRKSVQELFGPLGKGEPPAMPARPDPRTGGPAAGSPPAVVNSGPDTAHQGPQVCVGWLAPLPSVPAAGAPAAGSSNPGTPVAGSADAVASPGYAEFLVLATRLWTRSARRERATGERPQVAFAPLDDPDFLLVTAGVGPMEEDAAAMKRVESFVAEVAAPPLQPGEAQAAKFQMANFLGTASLPDTALASNPYLVAFSLGRREQLGLRGRGLATALDAVTEDSFRKFVDGFLPRRAGVVVRPGR